MIQIAASGVRTSFPRGGPKSLRARYRTDRFILLPGLLEPELLRLVLPKVRKARFSPKGFPKTEFMTAETLCEPRPEDRLNFHLNFLLNSPAFLKSVSEITRCGPIAMFQGGLIRMRPEKKHFIRWHCDTQWGAHRVASLTMNLSPRRFKGGRLQVGYPPDRVLGEVANTGLGDAVLFDPGPGIFHRNTPLEGEAPKISFIGWFLSRVDR